MSPRWTGEGGRNAAWGVARWQLLAAGWGPERIRGLLEKGYLLRIHPGVYAVGHRRLTRKGRWMAAVLAGGPTAVLSHRAAVALRQLRRAPDAPFDVTVPGRIRKGGRGLQAGLPEPSWNVLVHGFLVDFSWPRQRLVVEVDGYAFH